MLFRISRAIVKETPKAQTKNATDIQLTLTVKRLVAEQGRFFKRE